jgi:hypothetical protein
VDTVKARFFVGEAIRAIGCCPTRSPEIPCDVDAFGCRFFIGKAASNS